MNITEWLVNFWTTKNAQQKTNIVFASLIFIGAFFLIFTWAQKPNYKTLYSNLGPEDAATITKKLQEDNVPYKVQNESTVLVPQKYLYDTRIKLAGLGLPSSGHVGFEIFDKMNFQSSEFVENVNYARALQGELADTIMSIGEIKAARVMLNLPKDSLYMDEQTPATASVVLSISSGQGLPAEKVQAIAYLVSSSIKNLKPEDITIVDDKGNLLYSPTLSSGGFAAATNFQIQKNIQRDLELKSQNMLDKIFGPGKSLVKVSVEMEFDKTKTEKETFKPIANDRGILRSSQEILENYQKKGTNEAYDNKNIIHNYELNREKEEKILSPGTIKRITAGVFLDQSISVDDKTISDINQVLEASIGINKERKDSVTIKSIPFNAEYWKEQETAMAKEQSKQSIINLVKIGSPVLAVLLFIVFFMMMMKKLPKERGLPILQIPQQPAVAQAPAMIPQQPIMPSGASPGQPPAGMPPRPPSMPPPATPGLEADVARLQKMANDNPQEIAKMLDQFLSEGE